jgi:hypothetical protein
MKFCPKCCIEKPVDTFNRSRRRRDGLQTYCKPCHAVLQKRWGRANPHKLRESANRHEKAHPNYKALWASSHPGNVRTSCNKKDYIRRGGVHLDIHFTEVEWRELCDRLGNRCVACGAEGPTVRDHIVPISLGGDNSIDNIQPLCKPCNIRKHNKAISYRKDVVLLCVS